MTILTPTHANTSANQAATATADLAKHQARVQLAEVQRQADPLGGIKLHTWTAPPDYGRCIESVATRRNGIPCVAMRWEKHRAFVYVATVPIHGIE